MRRIINSWSASSTTNALTATTMLFAVADAIKPRYRVLMLFGAFTSLRFGELAALQRSDIDVAGRTVYVRKSQAESDDDGYVFVGPLGGRVRRHNFRKVWLDAVAESKIKKTDVHFHDLRHTGNDLAAKAGATTKELMARMGHSSVRAAIIYQHATRERDHEIAEQMNRNVEKIRKPKKKQRKGKGHARREG